MLSQRAPLNDLFTFGYGQLEQCLSKERRNKFPFLQNLKIKKTPLLHKMISQQRQKVQDNENINLQNLPQSLRSRGRVLSQGSRKIKISLHNQTNQNDTKRKNSTESKNTKKRQSLPKVFKHQFGGVNTSFRQKRRIISADPSMRYSNQQQSTELPAQCLQQYQSLNRETRPKSVMFLSQFSSEIPEQKIKTIHSNMTKLQSRGFKLKTNHRLRIPVVNHNIIQNINELKKIYC